MHEKKAEATNLGGLLPSITSLYGKLIILQHETAHAEDEVLAVSPGQTPAANQITSTLYTHANCIEVPMNKINPTKLLNSKWTAVTPTRKEKHFLVSEIEFDEEGVVVSCSIEAVMTNRLIPIDWHELKDDSCWVQGWK